MMSRLGLSGLGRLGGRSSRVQIVRGDEGKDLKSTV
jgi:hypothetical protein